MEQGATYEMTTINKYTEDNVDKYEVLKSRAKELKNEIKKLIKEPEKNYYRILYLNNTLKIIVFGMKKLLINF